MASVLCFLMEYHVEVGPCGFQTVLGSCSHISWIIKCHFSNSAVTDLPWRDHSSSWLLCVLGELHLSLYSSTFTTKLFSTSNSPQNSIGLIEGTCSSQQYSARHSVCIATNPRSLALANLGKVTREGRPRQLFLRNQIPSVTVKCSSTGTMVLA